MLIWYCYLFLFGIIVKVNFKRGDIREAKRWKGELTAIMLTGEIRKGLGLRIKELRKQNKWTQKALAAKLDMHFAQLNKYECGLNSPPLEKLVELAEVFNTTVDYLLTGNSSDERPLHNLRLLERFKELEAVNAGDQETVINLIDAMIVKNKVEGAVKPLTKAG